LDRIESLPADLQLCLLQRVEEDADGGLGTAAAKPHDVRIIAAADTELEGLVDRGVFRKDLYYRLNVLSVTIPPLRNRREDIPLLADFFADKFCLKLGRGCLEISSKVQAMLCGYHWPGNVAELENIVRDMVVSGDESKIVNKLGGYYKKNKHWGMTGFFEDSIHPVIPDLGKHKNDSSKLSMKEICRISKTRTEGELMKKALEFTNWNRKKTAKMLKISYKSLLNKIKAYSLEKET
jgi:two-component system response regulator AtoC